MKLLIIGSARSGKDTVAGILNKRFGMRHKSSSEAALDIFLYDTLNKEYDLCYVSKEQAFEDRINHRATWFNEISMYNTPDKARLAREIMEDNDIYVGMRSKEEIDACLQEGIFDYVIGVDNQRVDKEDESSNDVDMWAYSDIVINNDGTLEELEFNAIEAVMKLKLGYANR